MGEYVCVCVCLCVRLSFSANFAILSVVVRWSDGLSVVWMLLLLAFVICYDLEIENKNKKCFYFSPFFLVYFFSHFFVSVQVIKQQQQKWIRRKRVRKKTPNKSSLLRYNHILTKFLSRQNDFIFSLSLFSFTILLVSAAGLVWLSWDGN